MKISVRHLLLCAMFAALCALLSQLYIPLPFTPIIVNLATLAVFLAGSLLGAGHGALSMLIYVLLGAVGIPVFAGFKGGAAALLGPTGGYIVGYVAAAALIGALRKTKTTMPREMLSMAAGLFACYLLGTLWFMVTMHTALWPALLMCVFPFIPGDVLKIALAAFLCVRIRPHIENK